MNAIIEFDGAIATLGKYGKLITVVIGIMILRKPYYNVKLFLRSNLLLVGFWIICMFFAVYRAIEVGLDFDLIQHSILFILFIYFFYLLSLSFKRYHSIPNYHFFKSLAQALNWSLVFWTGVAFLFQFQIWHTDELEGRNGLTLFYGTYIQLGILAVTGVIANFSVLKYKRKRDRYAYTLMLAVYLLLVVLSQSRNAQLMVAVFFLINFLPAIKRMGIKYLNILTIVTLGIFGVYFSSSNLLSDGVMKFTSGRSSIWYDIYDYYLNNSILNGQGILGLNQTILNLNIDGNYYYQRIEVLYFHSSFLEVFSAGGLIGFAVFFMYLIKKIRMKKQFYILTIILSALVGGLFESFLVQPTILIAFLFWYFLISNEENPNGLKRSTV